MNLELLSRVHFFKHFKRFEYRNMGGRNRFLHLTLSLKLTDATPSFLKLAMPPKPTRVKMITSSKTDQYIL